MAKNIFLFNKNPETCKFNHYPNSSLHGAHNNNKNNKNNHFLVATTTTQTKTDIYYHLFFYHICSCCNKRYLSLSLILSSGDRNLKFHKYLFIFPLKLITTEQKKKKKKREKKREENANGFENKIHINNNNEKIC